MDFMKVDPAFTLNPKVRDAGMAGGWLFLTILGVNAMSQRDGRLSPQESTKPVLALRGNMRESDVHKALSRLVKVGLISQEADGGIVILGWDDQWRGALTNAERQKRWRKRTKTEDRNEDVTDSNGAPLLRNDRLKDGLKDGLKDSSQRPPPKGGARRRPSERGEESESDRQVRITQELLAKDRENQRRYEERLAAEEARKNLDLDAMWAAIPDVPPKAAAAS